MDIASFQSVGERLLFFFGALLAGILAAALTGLGMYVATLFARMKKREKISLEMITMQVILPKYN
jgi:anaerobic C4-dicarboxylate transporter